MERFADWCAFAGAWLLFAGPVFQAETELDAEVREGEEFMETARSIEVPPSPSWRWWLLPPVGWELHRRHNREIRRRARAVLSDAQTAQLVRFSQKATGWMLVGGGAGLIAIDETWTLTHAYAWSDLVFWVIAVVMAVACVAFTAIRARGRDHLIGENPGKVSRRES